VTRAEVRRLREAVCEANLDLVRSGLVFGSFGNASGIDREHGVVGIKPSGVAYARLKPADIVLTRLDGTVIDGALRPSSDLPTHLVLYRAWASVGGVTHTHSRFATAWAQAAREIPCLGTTHADHVPGAVPLTRAMTPAEIRAGYEEQTGKVIVRRLKGLDPAETMAVLVRSHGPFTWGPEPAAAAKTAAVLEELAHLAWLTTAIEPRVRPIPDALREKHFRRKHGPNAYYGQAGRKA
jgi:L-ribulose-5-phosphate 4-epimerase